MRTNYTSAAQERCLALIDSDIENIWNDLELMPDDSDSEKWKKKFTALASEYILSGRFALMRIFQKRSVPAQELEKNPKAGFTVNFSDGSTGEFRDISMEHAEEMKQDELDLYEKLMMDRASRQAGANHNADCALIRKALKASQRCASLTRDEALALGHIINLTLNEMQWFLLRVLNVDGGFRYNCAEDLIDAYVFLRAEHSKTGASAEKLKSDYHKAYDAVPKTPHDPNVDWTTDNGSSLPDCVRAWPSADCDKQFMNWMGERAEHLDRPSETALRIFRNLAVFTYNLAKNEEAAPNANPRDPYDPECKADFVRCIREIVSSRDYADQTMDALFEDGKISEEKCQNIAGGLLVENQDFAFSDETDKTKPWSVIDFLKSGNTTVSGGVNKSRTRLQDILCGKEKQIDKSDILYLLWFTANLCWFSTSLDSGLINLKDRLYDFIEVADNCLDKAGLPGFYPPHLIEQSMMLSFVYANKGPEKCDPAVVYEQICSSLRPSHAGGSHAGKHTPEEKRDIVTFFHEHNISKAECAKQYGISPKTLSAWLKEFKTEE